MFSFGRQNNTFYERKIEPWCSSVHNLEVKEKAIWLVKLKVEWSKISMSRLILINIECWKLKLASYRQPPTLYGYSTSRYYYFFLKHHLLPTFFWQNFLNEVWDKLMCQRYFFMFVRLQNNNNNIMIMIITIITIIIIKYLFNVDHINLQNFHYIAEANKSQSWNFIDIITTTIFFRNK